MKTIYRHLVFSFIGPFLMTFFIAVFILFIQWVYVYMDDLIGKGLGAAVLSELFFYVALNTFTLALPLAILLSSLMTFGNLGEHFELVALKSSGMALQKIMRPLIIAALIISGGAFFFSNNLLPYVNLKMKSLVVDIQQKKPSLNIKEGIFYNGIDGYTIRIDKKGADGSSCSGIMIYDHTQNRGNTKVITAETGIMETTADKQFLILTLYNGTSFEETAPSKEESYHPLMRSKFNEQIVRFDLSGFKLLRTNEELFKSNSNYSMMNISQLNEALDSLEADREKRNSEFRKNFAGMFSDNHVIHRTDISDTLHRPMPIGMHHTIPGLQQIPQASLNQNGSRAQVIDYAMNNARSKKYYIESHTGEEETYDKPEAALKAEWHSKFTLSIACLVLFFIGAPLGAIIRKGGLGMPVVVSVVFFIVYWVITTIGQKLSKEGTLPPYIGMWIATAVFLPIGIFLTRKATSDSALFDTDSYLRPFQKLFRKKA